MRIYTRALRPTLIFLKFDRCFYIRASNGAPKQKRAREYNDAPSASRFLNAKRKNDCCGRIPVGAIYSLAFNIYISII